VSTRAGQTRGWLTRWLGASVARGWLAKRLALFALWIVFLNTSLAVQAASVAGAAVYSCIEFSWYALSTEDADGSIRFTPFVRR
jgi:hypothetical protein